ncbi:GAF domain-containing protein [Nocardiopsis sp. CNR-923]|uniref:GAF domain-containing protein n=1 Tax=Nocardiopsis sp. CNR-923 TaxID=1904965 RepID=UPI00373FDDFD
MDLTTVLRRLTEAAAELIGARYAGLGVVDEDGAFTEFVSVGMTRGQAERITRSPHGRGVLAAPLADGAPVRMTDLRNHPDFAGFPVGTR